MTIEFKTTEKIKWESYREWESRSHSHTALISNQTKYELRDKLVE